MFWQLSLQPSFPVQCIKLDKATIPATTGDDGTILENTDGEDGTIMDLPDDLGHCIVASAPDKHIAIGVTWKKRTLLLRL